MVMVEIYPEEKNGHDETAQCNNSQDHSVQNEFDMGLRGYLKGGDRGLFSK